MTLPKFFRSIPEKTTTNFDFVDLVQGKGIIKLYAATATTASALDYYLTSNALDVGTKDPTLTTDHERRSKIETPSIDFALDEFNSPRIVEGDVFISTTIAMTTSVSGANGVLTVEILKDATSLGSTTATLAANASSVDTYNIKITVARTLFKVGEKLVIKFSQAGLENGAAFLYHDPINRDAVTYTPAGSLGTLPAVTALENPTQTLIYVPVIINL